MRLASSLDLLSQITILNGKSGFPKHLNSFGCVFGQVLNIGLSSGGILIQKLDQGNSFFLSVSSKSFSILCWMKVNLNFIFFYLYTTIVFKAEFDLVKSLQLQKNRFLEAVKIEYHLSQNSYFGGDFKTPDQLLVL
jgi:hypothetical protein